MSKIDLLNQIFEEVDQVCETKKTHKWSNSWPWKNVVLTYYHLIYQETDGTFHYKNINDLEIEIEYENFYKKYRIDIKTRYHKHNFWLFDEDKCIFVKEYVKRLIKLEYDSIQKSYLLLELSDDAYMEKEPSLMYQNMNIKFRKDKLGKLIYV